MLNLLRKGKAGRNFEFDNRAIGWREVLNSSEDFITSNFFERLFYLPESMIWEILDRSLLDRSTPLPRPEILQYEFWPGWTLDNRVEPDLFIRCNNLDIIVEAKARDDNNAQSPAQWEREVKAYQLAYGSDVCHVILLAIGGNDPLNNKNETIDIEGRSVTVFKIRWRALLQTLKAVKEVRDTLHQPVELPMVGNILTDMIEYLNFHGYYPRELFNNFHTPYTISADSFMALTKGRPGMLDGLSKDFNINTVSLTTLKTSP
ncbi:hypothetical protein [Paraflavitalea pollutisoli]|uniref:hypothetical protein n=1 Tax=Paraflavitalea pollutisoli TaxID=3034143 RepID=UPI0023EDAE70|nr:hypothetical protein [Paraflavitalea sp. H1-2-19X]